MSESSVTEHTYDSTLEKDGDCTRVEVNLTEEDLEGLLHGSGFTLEWQLEDETLAVMVNSPREFDMDWLRRKSDAFDDPPMGFFEWLRGVVTR